MNLLFFLTPKSEVAYVFDDDSLREALEKMELNTYAAIPVLSRQGRYVGTLTEGDLLWYAKNQLGFRLENAQKISIASVPRSSDNVPVTVSSKMEDLLEKAMNQNFVPVLDDNKAFIGIVTRKDIMKYFVQKTKQKNGA